MTRPPQPSAWLLLEGGGSRTWAATATGDTVLAIAEGPSTNPRSVGEDHAVHTLVGLFDRLWDSPGTAPLGIVAAHGAASTGAAAGDFAALVRRALARSGPPAAPVLVTNDIAPLLLAAEGPVCVGICGTGTGFAARNGERWARASGLEWLLSDEGGGHDLATAGLRAAIRSLDGRGPATTLTGLARQWCSDASGIGDLGEALFFHVYDTPDTKPLVASFARHVLDAAEAGDGVAGRLVENAAAELAGGVAAVCRATGISAHTAYTLMLSGSLLTESALLRRHFLTRVQEQLPPIAVLRRTPRERPQELLSLRDLWLKPGDLSSLAAALPTHADPAPAASEGALP
ncbi:N-acetylglucosamine kinase [Streptomyces sp. NPDC015032]|uniref:N-acetylglucosamine kinase n=1 Tax=Streptomyces sp. NPDC015032 TaxID=3364937 RepID=UPI0036F8E321